MNCNKHLNTTMINKSTHTQTGASNLAILVFILCILAGVYVCSQVFPFYYSYYELKGLMESQAEKGGELKDGDIKRVLTKAIKKLDIPADPENLKINRYAGKIIIELKYSEVLFVDFGDGYDYDLWEFNFEPRAEKPL